jgi:oligopeptide transport system substrate-binding protein
MRMFIKHYVWMFSLMGLWSCNERIQTRKIFRLNQVQGVETLDPAFAKNLNIMWHTHVIYNRLIEYNSRLEMVPSLAKRWHISSDRRVYTFILRDDVYFQDNPAFEGGVAAE